MVFAVGRQILHTLGLGPLRRIRIGRCSTGLVLLTLTSPAAAAEGGGVPDVHPVMVGPFVLLLAAIAVVPFIDREWWDQNYPAVCAVLGTVVVAYYLFVLRAPLRLAQTGLDYISFIALIGSLFVVTGTILIRIDRPATPFVNAAFLLMAAIASNLLGTTGASALLIRPFVRINRGRVRGYHVVFFIFLVSNIGGALTPIGDPPLFLGYLKGVPFFWVLPRVWHIWALTVLLVLAVFMAVDARNPLGTDWDPKAGGRTVEILGGRTVPFLGVILGAVFLSTPLREGLMVAAAASAYVLASPEALRENEFTFQPIREVAILFAGIFATMVPALDWLERHAAGLGITSPGQFYWGSGILSSVLDNAPTYLNFLAAAFGLHHLKLDNAEHMRLFLSAHGRYVVAVSLGAVFFGANTYIGNGPNFMVKSIAEHAGVDCPSFFGYVFKYSLPILIPVFGLIWALFLRS